MTLYTTRWALGLVVIASTLLVTPTTFAVETDLNVTHIERTPKYDYDAAKNMPEQGDIVTFWAHVRHWGDETSPVLDDVEYEWRVNGVVFATGTLSDFEPLRPPFDFDYTGYPNPSSDYWLRQESRWPKDPTQYDSGNPPTGLRVVSFNWPWEEGRHTIEFVIDPNDAVTEKTEENNAIVDYTDAILASFWVEESLWKYFHQHQDNLGIGSNSWEDWIQRQMAKQNELYEDAVYPELTPNGISTRVRIDRLIVVPDGILPVNGGLPSNNPDSSDRTIDLQWGFASLLLDGSMYSDTSSVSINNAFYIEQSLIHELGHARYLIDSYGFNVHDQDPSDRVIQIYEDGQWIVPDYLPWVWENDMVYMNKYGGVMTGPYGFKWGPYEAAMLERIGHDRACCGNMNSPGNIGEYLQELPQNNWFRFTDENGWYRPNVNVRVFRATGRSGVWYGKTFDGTHDAEYDAGADGWINFGQNPFTGGSAIYHTFGLANSVMIVRVEQDGQVWYRFIECSDFNLEYYKGNTQDAYYAVELDGPNNDSDGDGLADHWELDYFTDLSHSPSVDEEPDGLTNLQEIQNKTHPLDADSDDDGLDDGEEVQTWHTDPLDDDSDDDGVFDGDEVDVLGTDPLDPDTDGDAYDDGVDNCPVVYNPGQADWDGDGVGDACAPGPRIDGVLVPDATTLIVAYTVPVDESSAEDITNYVIDNGGSVTNATLGVDLTTVTLTTTTLVADMPYTLTISDVYDRESPPNVIIPGSQIEFMYSAATRVTDGLVVLYTFDEGDGDVVYDVGEVGTPLDLTIDNPATTHWTLGGLSFDSASRVKSSTGAAKVVDACMVTDEITVEAWVKPADLLQHGPARIMTVSTTASSRNVTLGQGDGTGNGSQYGVWLRTSEGDATLMTPGGTAALQLQHVLFTRTASGAMKLYVNGDEVANAVQTGAFSTWNSGYRLTIGNEMIGSYPWLGSVRLAAIYDRALTPAEVADNYAAGADPTTAPDVTPGDCNCDGQVDYFDIGYFVAALGDNEQAWRDQYLAEHGVEPPCSFANCDADQNGSVDYFDINAFLDLLGS